MMIDIVPYQPEFQPAFERLNRQWLEAHSLLEPADLECLQDPERYVLAAGGQVFFAMDHGEVVGTCAAIRFPPSSVELAKLAVSPDARGRGIGRRLCNHVLQFARGVGATEVVLTSNSALVAAIRLYAIARVSSRAAARGRAIRHRGRVYDLADGVNCRAGKLTDFGAI